MLIQAFLIIGAVVPNNEMSPTLKQGDRILVSKIQNTFNSVHNSDVVMYKYQGKQIIYNFPHVLLLLFHKAFF